MTFTNVKIMNFKKCVKKYYCHLLKGKYSNEYTSCDDKSSIRKWTV